MKSLQLLLHILIPQTMKSLIKAPPLPLPTLHPPDPSLYSLSLHKPNYSTGMCVTHSTVETSCRIHKDICCPESYSLGKEWAAAVETIIINYNKLVRILFWGYTQRRLSAKSGQPLKETLATWEEEYRIFVRYKREVSGNRNASCGVIVETWAVYQASDLLKDASLFLSLISLITDFWKKVNWW